MGDTSHTMGRDHNMKYISRLLSTKFECVHPEFAGSIGKFEWLGDGELGWTDEVGNNYSDMYLDEDNASIYFDGADDPIFSVVAGDRRSLTIACGEYHWEALSWRQLEGINMRKLAILFAYDF